MPEDRSETIDYHSSVQIPPVLCEYRHSIVDTTSVWTRFISKRTSKAPRSYTEGSLDAGVMCGRAIWMFSVHEYGLKQ